MSLDKLWWERLHSGGNSRSPSPKGRRTAQFEMYTLALIHPLGELQDSVHFGDVEIMGGQQGRREKCVYCKDQCLLVSCHGKAGRVR